MEGGHQQQQQQARRNGVQVLDGSDIRELVENKEEFARFVENKFRHLDRDGDGRLSVRELQPAVADIGAAIGLPARGSSAQADHIYSEVCCGDGDFAVSMVFISRNQLLSNSLDGIWRCFICASASNDMWSQVFGKIKNYIAFSSKTRT
jgi:hypothetical protein